MNKDKFLLSDLPLGKSGTIINMMFTNQKRKFFENMGLICGTEIIPVQKSLCGTPIAYCFRGAIIALRKEDTDQIIVNSECW